MSIDSTHSDCVRRRRILTKTVNPEWYRRYAKILNYEDRIFYQPLREVRAEAKMLKELEPPPNPNDRAAELSRKLMEERKKKIKMVLQILEGNFRKLDLSSLKPSGQDPLSALHVEKEEQVQTLFWRKRVYRPPGYVLSPNSKWRLFWENERVMKRFQFLVSDLKSSKIRHRWRRAVRLFQSIYRFNRALANIAGTTDDIFKKFRCQEGDPSSFQKNYFRASAVGKNLDREVMFTLSKETNLRTIDEAIQAAKALRVMQTFAEFPKYLQEKICLISWYLDLTVAFVNSWPDTEQKMTSKDKSLATKENKSLEKDKMIIREGHVADSFYFLLSGRVILLKAEVKNNTSSFKSLSTHTMGSLIGGEGWDGTSYREYSAYTMEKCKVIAVNVDDFHRKCLEGETNFANAPHISFLSQLPFLNYFPMQELVDNAENNVFLFYFNADTIVAQNVAESNYIYVVYKGSCRVLAHIPRRSRITKLVHVPPTPRKEGDHSPLSCKRCSRYCMTKITFPASSQSQSSGAGYNCPEKSKSALSPGERVKNVSLFDKPISVAPTDKALETFSKACDAKTIADAIKKVEAWKEDSTPINLNLVGAASKERFLTRDTRTKDWIQLKVLREGDTIGLESLDLGDSLSKSTAKFDVVSEGAEVIAILKSFVMENASSQMLMDLRASSYIHPDETQLRAEMDRRSAWRRFQNSVMEEMRQNLKLPPI